MSAPRILASQLSMSEGNRRGNTVGEQGHARGVPPSPPPGPTRIGVDDSAARYALLRANFNQRCGLLNTRIGAALCAARQGRCSWRGGQSQYRGVSDHHFGPLGLPSLRPARWSLTPRCLWLSRSASSSDVCVRGGIEGVQIRVANSGRRAAIAAARNSRAQGAARMTRYAPPALRAADGLDRASRDPFPGNYRRSPHGSA